MSYLLVVLAACPHSISCHRTQPQIIALERVEDYDGLLIGFHHIGHMEPGRVLVVLVLGVLNAFTLVKPVAGDGGIQTADHIYSFFIILCIQLAFLWNKSDGTRPFITLVHLIQITQTCQIGGR
ncbi:MAG: hypothetical protein BWY95_02501 [Bacteroidetes bacterium ADurb.BinA104]|nr:MAG: hypothetical protein BWY95_02501 [Bacteroidetes bacterium ADurb.BinA104]